MEKTVFVCDFFSYFDKLCVSYSSRNSLLMKIEGFIIQKEYYHMT